jgi:beta-N-acetylhexosaminidase
VTARVLPTLLPGFAGTTLPGWLEARLRDGLGGVCLFAANIESHDQLRTLTDTIYAANPRAIVAIDEEGGDVTRLFAREGSPSPGNAVLGRIDDLDTTAYAARQIGAHLRPAGVNLDFAPSVDINSNPDNPVIGVRSFGVSADRVAAHGAAWITGLQSTGVAATAKHFPGHGDTALDSHLALPVIDRSLTALRDRELVPFAAAIEAGVRVVMTSHILLPQLDADHPATLSPAVLGGLLRRELGFAGVIVTDALDMAGAHTAGGLGETAVRALAAGCDLLCLGTNNTDADLSAIVRAVAAGGVDSQRIAEAADRVRALADDLAVMRPAPVEGPSTGSSRVSEDHLVRAFDLQPTAAAWRDGRPEGSVTVIRLQARPNSAAGPTPWGPPRTESEIVVSADRPLPPAPIPAESILVIGQDIHRHAFARDAVDRLRAQQAEVLVVDMGWPSPDRRYADVATFGASALIGRALLNVLRLG